LPEPGARPPFPDLESARRFEDEGLLMFPLLDAGELDGARDVYHRHHGYDLGRHVRHDFSSTFFTSVFVDDLDYRRRLHEELSAVMQPALRRVFSDFKVWYAGFVARLPASGDPYEPHTDPSFVDEAVHVGLHVWCPIEDANLETGAFQALPRSRHASSAHRGGTLPCRLRPHSERLKGLLRTLPVPAGTAIAFHPGTLHGSTPNRSSGPRVSATVLLSDGAAGLQTAYRDPARPDSIDLYAQPDDYYVRSRQFTERGNRPPELGRLVGSIPFDRRELSFEEIERHLAS
jgi:hypothetical protein